MDDSTQTYELTTDESVKFSLPWVQSYKILTGEIEDRRGEAEEHLPEKKTILLRKTLLLS